MEISKQKYDEMQITLAAQTSLITSQKKQIENLTEQVRLKEAMLQVIESASKKGLNVAAIF